MSERHQLGDATLELLADPCILVVLDELRRGPVRASEIERRAPGIPRWTALRRLQSLARDGFVRAVSDADARHRRGRSGASQARYTLTDLGSDYLLKVTAAAVHCEQNWCPPPPEQPDAPGLWVLGLLADPPTRALARALADAPLRSLDLQVRLPHLRRSTLLRRLRTLPDGGVLLREEHRAEVRYALSDSARHLVIVPLLAAQCEWRRATPDDRALSGDLPGLLHVLAPLARTPQSTSGTASGTWTPTEGSTQISTWRSPPARSPL